MKKAKTRKTETNDHLGLDFAIVKAALPRLLIDKTKNCNIIWATNSYQHLGELYLSGCPIAPPCVKAVVQPRFMKNKDAQIERTRKHGEVFTPSWICNYMNSKFDEAWFERLNVFNIQENKSWTANPDRIIFPDGKSWKDYVLIRQLEITCGEAPFLVSRYDSSTGEVMPIEKRIGLLDRKLRVISENTNNEADWVKWTERAFQSIYGYEYQGDNLIVARINCFLTFAEYLDHYWHRAPTEKECKNICNIISWNLWQMDGLTGRIPTGQKGGKGPEALIYDWSAKENKTQKYNSLKSGDTN